MNPLTQCKKISITPLVIGLALVVLAALTALPAGAAPPITCGLTVTSLTAPYLGQFAEIDSKAKSGDWEAEIETKGLSDLHIVQVTIQPGGYLGWHSHAGPSFVVVKSGTASFYEADDCIRQVIPAGGTLFEPAGDVHMVRNESMTEPLVNVVIQLLPTGSPRAIGEPDPGCFQLTCPYSAAN
jgi:quercetin dioxygenase-like cupin family protein